MNKGFMIIKKNVHAHAYHCQNTFFEYSIPQNWPGILESGNGATWSPAKMKSSNALV